MEVIIGAYQFQALLFANRISTKGGVVYLQGRGQWPDLDFFLILLILRVFLPLKFSMYEISYSLGNNGFISSFQ